MELLAFLGLILLVAMGEMLIWCLAKMLDDANPDIGVMSINSLIVAGLLMGIYRLMN